MELKWVLIVVSFQSALAILLPVALFFWLRHRGRNCPRSVTDKDYVPCYSFYHSLCGFTNAFNYLKNTSLIRNQRIIIHNLPRPECLPHIEQGVNLIQKHSLWYHSFLILWIFLWIAGVMAEICFFLYSHSIPIVVTYVSFAVGLAVLILTRYSTLLASSIAQINASNTNVKWSLNRGQVFAYIHNDQVQPLSQLQIELPPPCYTNDLDDFKPLPFFASIPVNGVVSFY